MNNKVYVVETLVAMYEPEYEVDSEVALFNNYDKAKNLARELIIDAIMRIHGYSQKEADDFMRADYYVTDFACVTDDTNKIIVAVTEKTIR